MRNAESGATGDEKVPIVPAYVERRESCPRYLFGGGVWIVLADSKQTAGHIANLESIYQKSGGLPRHVHEHEDEMAYVISGRLRVRIGDEGETTADPGAMIFVPRGTPRSFIADVDDTRVYHGFVPGGFEALIVENAPKSSQLTATVGESAPIDPATAKRFGLTLLED